MPGYFAADGDAANTSATSGNKWRVNFMPDARDAGNTRFRFATAKTLLRALIHLRGNPVLWMG